MKVRLQGQQETRVRAKRISTETRVVVDSKTLGTQLVYRLPMENLSRTGFLVNMGGNRKLPFLVNTLLEMTIDPQATLLEQPVTCLGKIVRMQQDQARKTQLGIQIVQIEGVDAATWEKALQALELTPEANDKYLPAAG